MFLIIYLVRATSLRAFLATAVTKLARAIDIWWHTSRKNSTKGQNARWTVQNHKTTFMLNTKGYSFLPSIQLNVVAPVFKIILSNDPLIWSFNIEKINRWRKNKRIKRIETNLLHQGGYGVVWVESFTLSLFPLFARPNSQHSAHSKWKQDFPQN